MSELNIKYSSFREFQNVIQSNNVQFVIQQFLWQKKHRLI